MKRYYTIINYLLCSICLLWMTGCSGILDDMRPKDQIPQDMLSECMPKWKNWYSNFIWMVM